MVKNYKFLNAHSLMFSPERHKLAIFDFGMTLGTVWALIVVTLTAIVSQHPVAAQEANSFILILATLYPGYSPPLTAADLLLGIVAGFVHGSLFGTLVAYVYNNWRGEHPFGVKLPADMTASNQPYILNEGVSAGGNKPPYTILILANPVLESELYDALRSDPILKYPQLFQAKVANIIGSLASDKTIRKKYLTKISEKAEKTEIPKMRIITYFNPKLAPAGEEVMIDENEKAEYLKNALCLEHDCDVIIEPVQRRYKEISEGTYEIEERLREFLKTHFASYYDAAKDHFHIDVVFAVTGSPTHTRSAARYTYDSDSVLGPEFDFSYDERHFRLRHDPYAKLPGMVAYSAWDDRLKTPLHEFAHAMASMTNGQIHDEYYDETAATLDGVAVINKRMITKAMDKNGDGIIQPCELPAVFATYNNEKFHSDKIRIVPESWKTFVPGRQNPLISCVMDSSALGEVPEFDRLLKKFIYQRLHNKAHRQEKAQGGKYVAA
jgi:hypothetical protein